MSNNKFVNEDFSDANTNQNGTPEDYTFIQETIRPRKKTKLKKLAFTIGLGAAFGIVACFAFCAFYPFFSDILNVKEEKVNIENNNPNSHGEVIQTPDPTPTVTATVTPTPVVSATPKPTSDFTETTPNAQAVEEYYANMINQVRVVRNSVSQCIVTVNAVKTGTDILDNPEVESNYTSGVIIRKDDDKLLILTNSDSVEGASYIKVTFADTSVCDGTIYGFNKMIGVALISVAFSDMDSRVIKSADAIEFGDSATLKVGDTVVALGNPNGYMDSIDYGVVSNKLHDAYITDGKVQLINTTIARNTKGNGFIFDRKGRIIGMITHKENFVSDYNANINTCLSISSIRPMIDRLINKEDTLYLGIQGNDISSTAAVKLGVKQGIYITKVEEGSPAFIAGVKKGDILVQVNQEKIVSVSQYYNVINALNSDAKAELVILRKQDKEWVRQSVGAKLGKIE